LISGRLRRSYRSGAEKATIPIDRAVPAGLIVNELVRNSIKYAFGNGGGLIRVHFAISQISEPF
jgi:two-component sensor histidine kinase